jgi:hypothetical protein
LTTTPTRCQVPASSDEGKGIGLGVGTSVGVGVGTAPQATKVSRTGTAITVLWSIVIIIPRAPLSEKHKRRKQTLDTFRVAFGAPD